jgi:hypothetical protein
MFDVMSAYAMHIAAPELIRLERIVKAKNCLARNSGKVNSKV